MEAIEALKKIEEAFHVPPNLLIIYARLWQLETWLREMVYVELKCYDKEWGKYIPKDDKTGNLKSEQPFSQDKRLSHMLTSEENPLAFLPFSNLWRGIILKDLWKLFSVYLPPKDILKAKIEEIVQIRNRIAYFRIPHKHDLNRVEQFLRDLDPGFWRFCTSYNDFQPIFNIENSIVVETFSSPDNFPYDEKSIDAYGEVGIKDKLSVLDLRIHRSIRPWVNIAELNESVFSQSGIIYHANFHTVGLRHFIRFNNVLNLTKKYHDDIIHIILDEFCNVLTITLPSVIGIEKVKEVILYFYKMVQGSLTKSMMPDMDAENISLDWPEYVLSPHNRLSFLCRDMPCSFFGME